MNTIHTIRKHKIQLQYPHNSSFKKIENVTQNLSNAKNKRSGLTTILKMHILRKQRIKQIKNNISETNGLGGTSKSEVN